MNADSEEKKVSSSRKFRKPLGIYGGYLGMLWFSVCTMVSLDALTEFATVESIDSYSILIVTLTTFFSFLGAWMVWEMFRGAAECILDDDGVVVRRPLKRTVKVKLDTITSVTENRSADTVTITTTRDDGFSFDVPARMKRSGLLVERVLERAVNLRELELDKITTNSRGDWRKRSMWQKPPNMKIINAAKSRAQENAKKLKGKEDVKET